MQRRELENAVRTLVEPAVTRLGFELVSVEWVVNGGTLRLSIDGPRGVNADDCGVVSEHVSPLLDQADPIDRSYTLEVSSPGFERPVQRTQDFERFTGFRAKLKLEEGAPRRRYTGTLQGVEGDTVKIEVDGVTHVIALEAIERAHLVLTLDEYQKLAPPQADAEPQASE